MTNRKLDVAVAGLLGLEVLGEAPCWQDECGTWLTSYDGTGKLQSVHLRFCACDCKEPDSILYFGHIAGCLEVVPFYHQSDTFAIAALEQICDKRELVAEMYRPASHEWTVEISPATQKAEPFTLGMDGNLSLAICKALAELEK